MKKLLLLLLVTVLCLTALIACDKDNGDNNNNDDTPAIEWDVEAAKDFVKSFYENDPVVTASDYEVIPQTIIGNATYTITWTVDTDKVTVDTVDGKVIINVDEKSKEEVVYVLTATITAGDGTTAQVKFNHKVPVYNVLSFEEYMAAKKDETVVIEGIVVAMNAKSLGNSRNHIFLADANVTGGYYSYQMDADPVKDLGIEIGMTVSVTGPIAPYYGMQEIKGGVATIVDRTIKTVAPVDITTAFQNGDSLKNYVGLPVTIKGVTIDRQALTKDTDQYLYFKLGEKESYLRTYITDFPTTLTITVAEDGSVSSADKTTIDEAHAAKFGWTANVTGILVLYSESPYLIPMTTGCFEYLEYVEKTAEEKVATELDNVTFDASLSSDKTVELSFVGKYYNDVTIRYASDSEYAVVNDTSIVFTVPETETVVTITVTAVCGEVTDSKTITVKLSKAITSIADALEIASGKNKNEFTEEKYLVAGVITEVADTKYGNLYIKDGNGDVIYIYGLYSANGDTGYDAMTKAPAVGDYIVVLSIIGMYNEPQLKSAWLQSCTSPISIPEFNTIAGAQEHDTFTEEKYVVTGVVSEIKNNQYGNVYIQDEAGNKLYTYGMYDIAGNRFDKIANQPKVGDTVVVYGSAGRYNETLQMKNATLVCLTAATTDEGGEEGGETTGPITVIADALAAADGTDVVLTGTVISAEAWNTEHNNMTVVISDGTSNIKAFRLKTKVSLGDVITVTGKMTTYSQTGEREIDAGCTAVIVDPAPVEVTIPEAVELADGRRVIVTGTVTEVSEWNTKYNNMNVTISDGTNTLYIFRLATQVKVGDVIIVTGKMGTYEGARQIAEGATAEFVVAGEIKVSVNMADLGYENAADFASEELDDVITVIASVGTNANGNTPKYYDSGAALRIYGGNTFTVSAADGYSIKTIVITTTSSNGITAQNVTVANGTMVVDGITVTITVTDGEADVVITNPASSGNVRIAAIEVVYEEVSTSGDVNTETGDTPTVEEETENA